MSEERWHWGHVEDKSFKRTTYEPVSKNGYRPQKLCLKHDIANGVFCNDRGCNCDHVDTMTEAGWRRMQKVKQIRANKDGRG